MKEGKGRWKRMSRSKKGIGLRKLKLGNRWKGKTDGEKRSGGVERG